MTQVLAARDRYNRVQEDAKKLINRERALYGRAIKQVREAGASQKEIAVSLGLSREQVRQYERYYDDWIDRWGHEPDAPDPSQLPDTGQADS